MCLGSEGLKNPSVMASTDVSVDMTLTPTVEVIRTRLVARKRKGVVCRQTAAL